MRCQEAHRQGGISIGSRGRLARKENHPTFCGDVTLFLEAGQATQYANNALGYCEIVAIMAALRTVAIVSHQLSSSEG